MSSLRNKLHNLVSDVKEAKAALQAHNVESYHAPPPSNMHPTPPPPTPPPTAPTKDEERPLVPTVKKEEEEKKEKGVRPPTPPPPPPRDLPHGWTARFDVKEGKFAYSRGVEGVEQWELPGTRTAKTPVPDTGGGGSASVEVKE